MRHVIRMPQECHNLFSKFVTLVSLKVPSGSSCELGKNMVGAYLCCIENSLCLPSASGVRILNLLQLGGEVRIWLESNSADLAQVATTRICR